MLILNELFKVLSERAIFFLFPNRHILFIKDVLVKSLERLISVIPAKFPMPRLGAWHPRMDENGLLC